MSEVNEFKDLVFERHHLSKDFDNKLENSNTELKELYDKLKNQHKYKKMASISFNNGYNISIITDNTEFKEYERWFYINKEYPYEVYVTTDREDYESDLTNDVIGYCNEEKVTEIIQKVKRLL